MIGSSDLKWLGLARLWGLGFGRGPWGCWARRRGGARCVIWILVTQALLLQRGFAVRHGLRLDRVCCCRGASLLDRNCCYTQVVGMTISAWV